MQLEHNELRLRVIEEVSNPHVEQVDESRAEGQDSHVQYGQVVDSTQYVEVGDKDERSEAGYRGSPVIRRLPCIRVKDLPASVLVREEADVENYHGVEKALCFHPEK